MQTKCGDMKLCQFLVRANIAKKVSQLNAAAIKWQPLGLKNEASAEVLKTAAPGMAT